MPTYQYRCLACGEELEAKQSFSDAALTQCPSCSGELRKVFGAAGVVFKGSGFYRNDSRSTSSTSGAGSSSPSTSSSSTSPTPSSSGSTSSTGSAGSGAA